ncbi:MAG: hypothetical protein CMF72_04845 [Mameliella sp.]|nr:hypothetical protein [Mameliella sp.]|tara:strand:- start:5118 stop:5438 length:321 start_codon:yes stop_codon:yes gene_type:complete
MICNADFDDLFPALFQPEHVPAVQPTAKAPSAACIARWEDDGGRHLPTAPQVRAAPPRRPAFGSDIERMVMAGAIAATAPAVATYAAASAMLSAYDTMHPRRSVMY